MRADHARSEGEGIGEMKKYSTRNRGTTIVRQDNIMRKRVNGWMKAEYIWLSHINDTPQ